MSKYASSKIAKYLTELYYTIKINILTGITSTYIAKRYFEAKMNELEQCM